MAEVNNNQVEADRQQRSPASALAGEAVRAGGGGGGDLQRATSLLVILYLDTALSRGEAAQCLRSDHVSRVTCPGLPHVNRIHASSVQLATAAVLMRPGEDTRRRYNHAASLLAVLYIQLSLASSRVSSSHNTSLASKVLSSLASTKHYCYAPLVYHGNLGRRGAEAALQHARPGTFLLRTSDTAASAVAVLSVRAARGCVHLKIEGRGGGGGVVLGGGSPRFPSLEAMVRHYSAHHLPLRGHTAETLRLREPALERLL